MAVEDRAQAITAARVDLEAQSSPMSPRYNYSQAVQLQAPDQDLQHGGSIHSQVAGALPAYN